ncbi:hypothetical protein IPU70_19090 [Achromobacter sp. SD115]|uniref:hypothetical protein n=1 Tax=Achromobacter sp. SD115 TaxID=2782011 RepID=UPI001A973CA2|nr:hypothetical protein [Achromobacter sp. SD115]MBO1015677.1 hypothetical protein [Achromobacter sp. SD115]
METNFLSRIKRHLILDGSIKSIYQYFLTVSGIALIFFDIKIWETGWIFYVGLILAGIGGLSGRAIALKIKPFEDPPYPKGWLDKKGERQSSDKN